MIGTSTDLEDGEVTETNATLEVQSLESSVRENHTGIKRGSYGSVFLRAHVRVMVSRVRCLNYVVTADDDSSSVGKLITQMLLVCVGASSRGDGERAGVRNGIIFPDGRDTEGSHGHVRPANA